MVSLWPTLCPSYSLQSHFTSFTHLGLEVSLAQCQETSHELACPFWCLLYKILNLSKKSLWGGLICMWKIRKERRKKISTAGPHFPAHKSDWSTVQKAADQIVQCVTLYQLLIFLAFLFTDHEVGKKQAPFLKKTNKLAKLSLYQVNKLWKVKYILASMKEPHFFQFEIGCHHT